MLLLSVVTFLLYSLCLVIGCVVIDKQQYPLRGNRLVTGHYAKMIGFSWLIPGVIGLFGLFLEIPSFQQSEQVLHSIRSVAQIAFLSAVILSFIAYRNFARDVEPRKRKRSSVDDILTVREAANFLKVEEIDIRNLIEDRDLKAKAIGGEYRITRDSIEDYLRS